MPDSAIRAAIESHGIDNPVIRSGMYVPGRRDVAQMPPEELHSMLIDWMWDCPSEIIPSNEQISSVKDVLLSRPDADTEAVRKIIAACDEFLKV